MCFVDSSAKNVNFVVVVVVVMNQNCDDDEVDKFVVVAAADRAIGVNGDRIDVKKYRFQLDYLDEVHLEPNAHSNRTLLSSLLLLLLHLMYNRIVVYDSCDDDTMADENNDNLNTDNAHNNFDVHKATLFVDNYDIHVLLQYEFARLHFVAADPVDKEMTIDPLDSTLATTLI